jgi:hypothetical protein
MLRPDAISALLRRESDPTRAANLLVDAANAAGGEDNITTIVIDIEDDGADPFAPATPSVGPEVTIAMPVALSATGATDAPPAASTTDAPPASAPPPTPARPTPAPAPQPAPSELPEGATAAQALANRERAARRKDHNAVKSVGRFARFLLPIVLILGLAFAVTAWYARRSYFVAFDHRGRVTIYQGRPGGLLLWDPTVVQHTKVTKDALTEDALVAVQDRKEFDNKDTALAFVGRVEDRANATTSTTTTTTTTTTPLVPVPST